MTRPPPSSTLTDTLFPYTTLFLSGKGKRPVLPAGYVFAYLAGRDIAAARAFQGVAGFCGTETRAAPIPDAEMEEFLAWGDADGCVPLDRPTVERRTAFEVGDVVRILSGPFEDFEPPVVADDGKDMVAVTATIFVRDTEVKLPYWRVGLI